MYVIRVLDPIKRYLPGPQLTIYIKQFMNLRNTNFLATSNFHTIYIGNFVTAYQFDLQRKGVELFSNVLNVDENRYMKELSLR